MATAGRTRGGTYSRDCEICGRPFTYVYLAGSGPRRCDDCTPTGKLNMRYRQAGRPLPERSYTCNQCGRDAVHAGAGQLPKRCPVCRGVMAPPQLAATPEPQAIEHPSKLPSAEPQPVMPAPQAESASAPSRPAEDVPSPATAPSPSVADQRRQVHEEIAAANARLAEEDQRRVVRPAQREQQSVQLLRRADDYDYILVDGVPAKVRRAAGAPGR